VNAVNTVSRVNTVNSISRVSAVNTVNTVITVFTENVVFEYKSVGMLTHFIINNIITGGKTDE